MDSVWLFESCVQAWSTSDVCWSWSGVRTIKAPKRPEFEARFAQPRVFSHILSSSEQAQTWWMASQCGSVPEPVAEHVRRIADC